MSNRVPRVVSAPRRGRGLATALAASLTGVALAGGQGDYGFEVMGYNDLLARLGAATPDGTGVRAAMVEASDTSGNYGPHQPHSQYAGITFYEESGPTGSTNHAHIVARYQYGNVWSIAPGITDVHLYSAGDWTGAGFLRTNQGGTNGPLPWPAADMKVVNNSWIGSFGPAAIDNDCLRRADFVVARDQVIVTSGVGNAGDSNFPLLSHMYNGIAVGIQTGDHVSADTLASIDGGGRMKPEVVAPNEFTSFGTPQVNATASLLTETARTTPGLSSNPNAEAATVLKATILAGAVHEDLADGTWSNNPDVAGPNRGRTDRPLDPVMGAGTVNVNRSHFILTGLEVDGADTYPGAPNAGWRGWDLAPVGLGASRFYRFDVATTADEVSIVATWNRNVRVQNNTWTVADIDLILWRDGGGTLETLVGNAGIGVFDAGNVVSESAVDNTEHLYLQNLAPGTYVLEVMRLDSVTTAPNWDVAVAWLFPEPAFDSADVNMDGSVNFDDLLAVLSAWGPCPGCSADTDGNGVVDFTDLLAVLSAWGS